MTEVEKAVVRFLANGWLDALHNSDTYLQMVKDIPDAPRIFQGWRNDPLRMEMTEARLQPLRAFVEAFLEDSERADLPTLLEFASTPKTPN